MASRMKWYFINLAVAIDQVGSALLGNWCDETLSSYAYRMEQQGKPWGFMRRVIDAIFFWQPLHCLMSYESERLRAQSPPEERVPTTRQEQP